MLYNALPKYLRVELESPEESSLVHFPEISYANAPQLVGIDNLRDHQEKLTLQLSQWTANNPSNKIHDLIPASNKPAYNLVMKRKYQLPSTKTKGSADSFINKRSNEVMYN